MLATPAVLLALTIGLLGPRDALKVTPDDFREWFEGASKKPLAIPRKVEARARTFRYVFVGGFRGESMRGYFAQNAQQLRSCGVPKSSIHFIATSSDQTVEENCEAFGKRLGEVAESGPERIVLIAHSRGACDALAFALRNPGFTSDRIEAMFLVQGPFGGSGLADYVMGGGPPVDEQMKGVPRLVARLIGQYERSQVSAGRHGSLSGLTRESSRAYWAGLIEECPEGVAVADPKTYYVEAETHPSKLRLVLRATASYLTLHYGPNDGVVARGDQTVSGIGTSLGVLEAGHSDLTWKGSATKASKRARRALIQAIVMAVGRDHV